MEGKYYKLSKDDIWHLIDLLKKTADVWAPVKTSQLNFQKLAADDRVILDYGKIQLGPKGVFFPHEEVLFKVKKGKAREPKIRPVVVLGAHPVDLIGFQRLDESFSSAPQDFYWQRRRKNSLVIGVEPLTNNYFSGSLAYYPLVFDLFFHQAKNHYLVEVNLRSTWATKLVRHQIFSATSDQPKPKIINRRFDKILSDPLKVSRIIDNSRGSKVWKELEKQCINCGICTYVCPLCYCYGVKDTISAKGDECKRCRYWDACTLAKFSEISGGFNFRETPGKRLYNWFYHKFVRAVKERGKIDCIGCNRCIEYCPAGINFRNVIEKLAKEQKII